MNNTPPFPLAPTTALPLLLLLPGTGQEVGPCAWCGGPMLLHKGADGCYTICCSMAGADGPSLFVHLAVWWAKG